MKSGVSSMPCRFVSPNVPVDHLVGYDEYFFGRYGDGGRSRGKYEFDLESVDYQ